MAEFVSLADLLRPPAPVAPAAEVTVDASAPDAVATQTAPRQEPPSAPSSAELAAVLRDARLFRARLADAFDEARQGLLRELATGVLARELRLAPCDLDALVRRVRTELPVVRVRVAPADAQAIRCVPVVVDAALASGDAIVELAGGPLDARLGVRLSVVLEAFA